MSDPDSPTVSGLDASRLLSAALASSPETSPAFNWMPPPATEVAEWFPDYAVERLAGRGAMGAVYLAVQKKLERPVAIKILPAELAARDGVEARFQREARALARLNHPGIVALHDFGRTEGGHLFIVMEYVDGTDLSRLIHAEGGGLSVPHALEIVGQVCDALQYAHGRGFVHRDIKPGNVLVDKDGRVKIADFGLAKLMEENAAAGMQADSSTPPSVHGPLTHTGQALGTPDYTAPEQLKGGPVDHRADIYSLGVMLYEMLTGDLPRGAWAPPSQRAAAPARLDEVVIRAMQTEPDKRYQQASEVKAAATASDPPPAMQPAPASGYSSVNRVMFWLMIPCIIASAFITPTSDALTMLMLAAPFIVLAAWFRFRRRPAGLVSLLLAGGAAGALIMMGAHRSYVQHPEQRQLFSEFQKASMRSQSATPVSERIIETEAKLSRLLVDYGEKHPEVLGIRAELETLRSGQGAQPAATPAASHAALSKMQEVCAYYDKSIETLIRHLSGPDILTEQGIEERSRNFTRLDGKRREALALGMEENHPLALEALRRLEEIRKLDEEFQGKSRKQAEVGPAKKEEPAEPSAELVREMEELRDEIAEFEKSRIGREKFWSQEETEWDRQQLNKFRNSLSEPGLRGIRRDSNAGKELEEMEEQLIRLFASHEAAKLEVISTTLCLSPQFRSSARVTWAIPEKEELPGGLILHFWQGHHPLDKAACYVENLAVESSDAEVGRNGTDLETFPDLWPLDFPLEMARLPFASPQSNAELDWISRTWPKETDAAGPGLVVGTFEAIHEENPQLEIKFWSRSVADLIPWAPLEPRPAPSGIHNGRIILKGGKCYTVFDSAPRPTLFGAPLQAIDAWRAKRRLAAGLPAVLAALKTGKAAELLKQKDELLVSLPAGPAWQGTDSGWLDWRQDIENIAAAQEAPAHEWQDGKLLPTRLVCSREVAEALAKAWNAQLPVPRNQQELNVLAQVGPESLRTHTGFQAEDSLEGLLVSTARFDQPDSFYTPGGRDASASSKGPTVVRNGTVGGLYTVKSRGLLTLYLPRQQ